MEQNHTADEWVSGWGRIEFLAVLAPSLFTQSLVSVLSCFCLSNDSDFLPARARFQGKTSKPARFLYPLLVDLTGEKWKLWLPFDLLLRYCCCCCCCFYSIQADTNIQTHMYSISICFPSGVVHMNKLSLLSATPLPFPLLGRERRR